MCNESDYSIISFPSTHHAMAGEKIAEGVCKNKETRLIPIPPEVSAGCGLALKLPYDITELVLDTLMKEGIQVEGVFLVQCLDGKKIYTKKN